MRTMWRSVTSMRGCPAQSKLARFIFFILVFVNSLLFRVFSSPYARGFGLVSLGPFCESLRDALRKKIPHYLGILPKRRTPPPPLLGTPYPKKKNCVYFAF